MTNLNELAKAYTENFEAARTIVAPVEPIAFDEGYAMRAQIHATLALAASTQMLVELFGTGAIVVLTKRPAQ